MKTSGQMIFGRTHEGKDVGFNFKALLTSHLLITGASGSGKSYFQRVIAECMFNRLPVFLVDAEEEFLSLRTKFNFVLIGDGGEVPIHPKTASATARQLMKMNVSAIFNLYGLEVNDQHLWVRDFVQALMNLPRKDWHRVAMLVSEAHLWCPESGEGESQATGAMINLASRGRKRGIVNVWDTQRLSKLNKNAASELQNVAIGRTFMHVDRERAVKVLGVSPRSKEKEQFFDELKVLEKGWFYLQGVAVSSERILVHVNEAKTPHPDPGDDHARAIKFPTPDQIKSILPELAAIPVEAEKREASEKELRSEITALRTQLSGAQREAQRAAKATTATPAPAPVLDKKVIKLAVEKAVMESSKERDAQWREALQKYQTALHKLQHHRQASISDSLKKLDGAITLQLANVMETVKFDAPRAITKVAAKIDFDFSKIAAAAFPQRPPVPHTSGQVTGTPAPRGTTAPRPGVVAANNGAGQGADIGKSPRQMILTMIQWRERGITRQQLASMTGIKSRGSSMRTYLTTLRRHNYLVEKNGLLFPSDQALQDFADVHSEGPQTTAEVVEIWKPRIGATPAKILDMLVDRQGEPLSREEVAGALEIDPAGSSMRTYLTTLRRAGLMVDVDGKAIAANRETLLL